MSQIQFSALNNWFINSKYIHIRIERLIVNTGNKWNTHTTSLNMMESTVPNEQVVYIIYLYLMRKMYTMYNSTNNTGMILWYIYNEISNTYTVSFINIVFHNHQYRIELIEGIEYFQGICTIVRLASMSGLYIIIR